MKNKPRPSAETQPSYDFTKPEMKLRQKKAESNKSDCHLMIMQ